MTENFIPALIGGLGGGEIFLIAVVLLLLFGGKKIHELMRGLGKGIREFKNAQSGMDEDEDKKKIDKSS
jgi:sec-independent protein translocase protein TatA